MSEARISRREAFRRGYGFHRHAVYHGRLSSTWTGLQFAFSDPFRHRIGERNERWATPTPKGGSEG